MKLLLKLLVNVLSMSCLAPDEAYGEVQGTVSGDIISETLVKQFPHDGSGACVVLRGVRSPVPGCTALHCTALHCTALHCTALHCTKLHHTVLHCTALHCTALRCTALHCVRSPIPGCVQTDWSQQ
jgi:hypothetical protein